MAVSFKCKENSSRSDLVMVTDLAEFLIKNKSYLDITFSLVSKKRNPLDGERVKQSINSKKELSVLGDEDLKELDNYKNLMVNFYNGNKDEIKDRRGRLLEKLVKENGPIKEMGDFQVLEEVLVYDDDIKVSEKDLDILFWGKHIEINECKASISNVVRDPMQQKNKEKLELLCKAKKLAEDNEEECNVFISTYSLDVTDSINDILKSNGFSEIEVLTGRKIISACMNLI